MASGEHTRIRKAKLSDTVHGLIMTNSTLLIEHDIYLVSQSHQVASENFLMYALSIIKIDVRVINQRAPSQADALSFLREHQ